MKVIAGFHPFFISNFLIKNAVTLHKRKIQALSCGEQEIFRDALILRSD
jgi:hypothetical protein